VSRAHTPKNLFPRIQRHGRVERALPTPTRCFDQLARVLCRHQGVDDELFAKAGWLTESLSALEATSHRGVIEGTR
jgi:hypothetical protein